MAQMALWRIRATVDDRPGYLSVLTASLALRSVNILSVQVHATEAGAVDEFLAEAPDNVGYEQLVEAVRRGRGRDPWVSRTDARGLIDEPTRVLGIAASVAGDPAGIDAGLVALLGDCDITHAPDSRTAVSATVMALADPAGGTIIVRRDEPAFTPAEFARAHALVQVATAARSVDSSY
jgi:hypothetical protein